MSLGYGGRREVSGARTAPGLRLSGQRGVSGRDGFSHALFRLKGRFAALLADEIEHRSLFLWLPVAFGVGILVYFAAPQEPRLWHGPLLAGIALVPAVLDTGGRKALGVALLFAALGFSAATLRTALVSTPMLQREMVSEVKGFVQTVDMGQGRLRLTLRPTQMSEIPPAMLPYALRIGTPAAAEVSPGDFVVVRARLSPPSEASMPGGYDFRRDAFFKSVGGVGYSLGKPRLEEAPESPPRDLAFKAWIDQGRNGLTQRIASAIGGQAGALSAALITGKRGLISEATNDDLRASGLYHIVSISGIHMVLAAGVLFWSVRAFLAAFPMLALGWPLKKIAALFAMLGATFYCVFSGSDVATERSLIMTLVMLGAILADRPALAMRNLAISALIVLAREPESLLGPSFQMSFAAVACLIGANRVWMDWRRNHLPQDYSPTTRILRAILLAFAGIAATTLVATLATGPFSVFHFHRVNPYGLIGNALALPLVSLVVMPCAVIGTLLTPLNLDWIIWRIMGEGVSGVLFVAEWVGTMENASYAIARFTLPAFGLMVLSLLIFVNFRTKLRALAFFPLGALLFVPLHPPAPDMVVDSNGKSLLARGEDGRYRLLATQGSNRFVLAQWLPAVGDNRLLRAPELREGVRCDKTGCALPQANNRTIALSITPEALREDCTRADIIITPLPAVTGCSARLLLDKEHFARSGASFVSFTPNGAAEISTALVPDARRPWRRTPPTDKQTGLARTRLAAWASPESWPSRSDGRRFFGLLPPPASMRNGGEVPVIEEDPFVLEYPDGQKTSEPAARRPTLQPRAGAAAQTSQNRPPMSQEETPDQTSPSEPSGDDVSDQAGTAEEETRLPDAPPAEAFMDQ